MTRFQITIKSLLALQLVSGILIAAFSYLWSYNSRMAIEALIRKEIRDLNGECVTENDLPIFGGHTTMIALEDFTGDCNSLTMLHNFSHLECLSLGDDQVCSESLKALPRLHLLILKHVTLSPTEVSILLVRRPCKRLHLVNCIHTDESRQQFIEAFGDNFSEE